MLPIRLFCFYLLPFATMKKSSPSQSSKPILINGLPYPVPQAAQHALMLQAAGRVGEAAALCEEILRRDARNPAAAGVLATLTMRAGQLKEARKLFEIAAVGRDVSIEVLLDYAECMFGLNDWGQARAVLERILRAKPDHEQARLNLARAFEKAGLVRDAERAFREIIASGSLTAPFAKEYLAGMLVNALGRVDEAIVLYKELLEAFPGHCGYLCNLGDCYMRKQLPDEAVVCLRQAKDIREIMPDNWQQLLYASACATELSAQEVADLHREFGAHVDALRNKNGERFANVADPERPLKIGMVSADLRIHPVGNFMASWLRYLDREQFKLYCYSSQEAFDKQTEALKPLFPVWRDVRPLSDEGLAKRIREDGIDILFDLSGCTYGNRILVFASRAAPVQVSYLGYFATTGVRAMDYILVNRELVPPGEEGLYSETPWYLDTGHLCFAPFEVDAAVAPLPAHGKGGVTFGCFNRHEKLTPQVLETWAKILHALPGSQLLIKNDTGRKPEGQEYMRKVFGGHGIDPQRVRVDAPSDRKGYFAAHHEVDIMLDPFPFNGATTTLDALWMGVPVLTMRGYNYVSHMAESILKQADLLEWVAEDREDYVRRAVAAASDLERLATLRAGMRDRLLASPLTDGPAFAAGVGRAMRGMWRRWCAAQGAVPEQDATLS